MADLNKLQTRIRALEARRAKGESVPELDALYTQMDEMQNEGYKQTTKNLSGEDLVKPKSKYQKHTEALHTEQEQQAKARGMSLKEFIRSETAKANKQIKEDTDPGGYKKGGLVSSASKRADGCATKGKTKGKLL